MKSWIDQINIMSIFWAAWGTLLIGIAYWSDMGQNTPVAADLCKMGGAICWSKVRSGSGPTTEHAAGQEVAYVDRQNS